MRGRVRSARTVSRLILAPSLWRVGRRPAKPDLEGGSEDDDEGEEKRKTGRAALSQLIAAVASTVRPK